MTYFAPSQQLPPDYSMAAFTTGVSLDTTSLVNPRCVITAVEASAPQVVGSLPPLDEFPAHVHQEQIVAEQDLVQRRSVEPIGMCQSCDPRAEYGRCQSDPSRKLS